jgi:glycine cleavage system H protein
MKMGENELPDNLLYNKDSSWIKVEDDTVLVGVIEPAAKRVKEFVFINLPEKGKRIRRGDEYVSLEAVKWSGHLTSPVSGQIIDVNKDLFDSPSDINKEPYKSWVMKVRLDDQEELSLLFKPEQIEGWLKDKMLKK